MWEDLIFTYKVARFWFAIFSCYSGLFGLYDLGIQIKVEFQSIITKWFQTSKKNIKFWFLVVSGLWIGLHDLRWPFSIFLRSLRPKKSSDMHQSYIKAKFYQKQFPLVISHFSPVCEDHGGVKPKELSTFVGLKSKISEKLDQNWSCLGQKTISSAKYSHSAKFGGSQAKQGRDLTASVLVQFFWNFRFRDFKYQ